ncbi:MAG TPA: hypothetical protein VME46_07425 [Acidimicrobiales bacterium]|nr:hypothetical protein [Acidimicrobiales bacterium]
MTGAAELRAVGQCADGWRARATVDPYVVSVPAAAARQSDALVKGFQRSAAMAKGALTWCFLLSHPAQDAPQGNKRRQLLP